MPQTAAQQAVSERNESEVLRGEDGTIRYAAVVDTEHGFILAGAATESYTTQLSYAVLQHVKPYVTARLVTPVSMLRGDTAYNISDAYVDMLKHPAEAGCDALRRGLHPGTKSSVIDWETFLPDRQRERVVHRLTRNLLEQTRSEALGTYRDVEAAVHLIYPQLGQHGLTSLLQDAAWQQVKTQREAARFQEVKHAATR